MYDQFRFEIGFRVFILGHFLFFLANVIPVLNISPSWDHLIFIMGIPILVRWYFLYWNRSCVLLVVSFFLNVIQAVNHFHTNYPITTSITNCITCISQRQNQLQSLCSFNTLTMEQDGHHFANDIFECILFDEYYYNWLPCHWSFFPGVHLTTTITSARWIDQSEFDFNTVRSPYYNMV